MDLYDSVFYMPVISQLFCVAMKCGILLEGRTYRWVVITVRFQVSGPITMQHSKNATFGSFVLCLRLLGRNVEETTRLGPVDYSSVRQQARTTNRACLETKHLVKYLDSRAVKCVRSVGCRE